MKNLKIVCLMLNKLINIMTRKQRMRSIKAFLAMLIAAIFETLGIGIVIPFIIAMIDRESLMNKSIIIWIMNNSYFDTIQKIIFGISISVIIVYLIKNIIILLSNYYQIKFRNDMEKDLSILMLHSYMKRPYTFFLDINSSEILRGISSDAAGVAQVIDGFFQFFSESITFGLIGIFLLWMNPIIAIGLIMIMLACALCVIYAFKGKVSRLGKDARAAFAERSKYAYQAVGGIKEITVMQRRDSFSKQFEEASIKASKCNTSYQFTSRVPNKIIEFVFITAIVLLAMLSSVQNVSLITIIPQLGALVVACVRLIPAISSMTSGINTLVFYKSSLEAASDNIHIAKEYEREVLSNQINNDLMGKDDHRMNFQKNLSINKIKWKYSKSNKYILNETCLQIQKGDAVAFIGESGAGKTTLADVILGLLKPQSGTILMDGIDVFSIRKQWAKIIGYVPQTVFLLDDTIRNNIIFGIDEEEIDDKLVWKALDQAQLRSFVESLPEGLDTVVGERGVKFSGGQRQRVAIARALYYNPDILVLDEATSALDNDTEVAVMEAIDALQGNKTLIIVAHRLSTIKSCDKIYEITKGKAIEKRKQDIFK